MPRTTPNGLKARWLGSLTSCRGRWIGGTHDGSSYTDVVQEMHDGESNPRNAVFEPAPAAEEYRSGDGVGDRPWIDECRHRQLVDENRGDDPWYHQRKPERQI